MKRRMGLFLMVGAVLPLVVASAAWACGVLATLSLDTKAASTDQAVSFKGKNYSTSSTASPVTVRLSTRAGKRVAETTPVTGGNIEGTFSTKGISPGWYVVTATQDIKTTDGRTVPKSGTPGRTTLRIGSSSAAAAAKKQSAAISPWASAKPTGPAGSAVPVAHDGAPAPLPILLAVTLSLMLLAGGATLVGRRNQTTSRPPLGV